MSNEERIETLYIIYDKYIEGSRYEEAMQCLNIIDRLMCHIQVMKDALSVEVK